MTKTAILTAYYSRHRNLAHTENHLASLLDPSDVLHVFGEKKDLHVNSPFPNH